VSGIVVLQCEVSYIDSESEMGGWMDSPRSRHLLDDDAGSRILMMDDADTVGASSRER
jgi:hypothetical protein